MVFKKYFISSLFFVFATCIAGAGARASSGSIEMPDGFDASDVVQLNRPNVREFDEYHASGASADFENMSVIDFDGWVRIGVMLPLSGKSASVGQSLKNAAEIALFSSGNQRIILQFYDTNNAVNGISDLTRQAISERVNIILGPLFANEARDVARVGRSYGVPVLTFSNDERMLQDADIHSMNYLLSQEIDRIVGFASSNGRKMIAVIIPEGESESIIKNAIRKSTDRYSAKIFNIATYENGDQESIVSAVQKISEYETRSSNVKKIKAAIDERLSELNGKTCAMARAEFSKYVSEKNSNAEQPRIIDDCDRLEPLKKNLEPINAVGQIPYDAIFIYGDSKDLVSIGSYLMYYDVNPRNVKFIGTSVLDNREIFAERGYYGAWFTSKNNSTARAFESEYRNVFGEYPSRLGMFAYDAVSVISALSQNGQFYVKGLNSPNGFFGISGLFKFTRDGEVIRSFDVKEVLPRTARTLSIAAKSFDEMERDMLANIEKSKSYSDEKIVNTVKLDWIIENLPRLKLEDINKYMIE